MATRASHRGSVAHPAGRLATPPIGIDLATRHRRARGWYGAGRHSDNPSCRSARRDAPPAGDDRRRAPLG
ncbi:hypothetical protein FTX61_02845 [Nitriliruptoraceae bacterium ZYF776]|nr:hypothetical protein [Profundirhabdus halotolerans]